MGKSNMRGIYRLDFPNILSLEFARGEIESSLSWQLPAGDEDSGLVATRASLGDGTEYKEQHHVTSYGITVYQIVFLLLLEEYHALTNDLVLLKPYRPQVQALVSRMRHTWIQALVFSVIATTTITSRLDLFQMQLHQQLCLHMHFANWFLSQTLSGIPRARRLTVQLPNRSPMLLTTFSGIPRLERMVLRFRTSMTTHLLVCRSLFL